MNKEQVILTDSDLDVIGEIMNISMGAAATAVSSMLEKQVTITTPHLELEKIRDVDSSAYEPAIIVKIKYVEGIEGTSVIMLRRHDMQVILNLLMGNEIGQESDDFEFDEMSMSAACEVMNQMMGSSATALSEVLNAPINISTPEAILTDNSEEVHAVFSEISGEESVVSISFKMMIKDVMDTNFISFMPTDMTSKIVSYVMNGVEDEPEAPQEQAPPQEPMPAQFPAGAAPAGVTPAADGARPQQAPPAQEAAAQEAAAQAPKPQPETAVQPQAAGQAFAQSGSPVPPQANPQPAVSGPKPQPAPQTPSFAQQGPDLTARTPDYTAQTPGFPAQAPGFAPQGQGIMQQPAGFTPQGESAAGQFAPQPPMMSYGQEPAYPPAQSGQPAQQQPQQPQQPPSQSPQQQPQYYGPYMQAPMGYGPGPYGYPAPPQSMWPGGGQPQAQSQVTLKKAKFPDFSRKEMMGQLPNEGNMGLLMGVPLEVSIVIGRARRKIKDILEFGQGTVVELDKQTGSPAEIMVNGQLLAYGDVIVVGDNFGIRVTEIVGTKELMDSLGAN